MFLEHFRLFEKKSADQMTDAAKFFKKISEIKTLALFLEQMDIFGHLTRNVQW